MDQDRRITFLKTDPDPDPAMDPILKFKGQHPSRLSNSILTTSLKASISQDTSLSNSILTTSLKVSITQVPVV